MAMARACTGLLLLAGTMLFTGCARRVGREFVEPAQASTLDHESPYLKAHLRDGELCILANWSVDEAARTVRGHGIRFDAARSSSRILDVLVPLDSVVLFETNVVRLSPTITSLAVVTGASVSLTIYCALNPKACFGSCPTFYVSDGEREVLQAEGFSGSVAPVLEASDIDALYRARPGSRRLDVRMTNEALETHVVRTVDLLVAPRPEGGRVLVTSDGTFWEAFEGPPLERASASEGDCTAQLAAFDGVERWSSTDSTDLAAREAVDLEFGPGCSGPAGLRLACRQTFVSTSVFYQSLAYLGTHAGDWIAELERGSTLARERIGAMQRALGGIEVLVPDSTGSWNEAARVDEMGPIATDVHLVLLPPLPAGATRVRLRLARGAWRLDNVALVRLGRRVQPFDLAPAAVHRDGIPDADALARLTDRTRTLTTSPGDTYVLTYVLPADFERQELFLASRGYYLEWMRKEWVAQEDPVRAVAFFADPHAALRAMAPEFKRGEASLETQFWGSRYVRP